MTTKWLSAILRRGIGIASLLMDVTPKEDKMKKASKLVKAVPEKKVSVKAAVKKTPSTISPKLSANHNETLLTR